MSGQSSSARRSANRRLAMRFPLASELSSGQASIATQRMQQLQQLVATREQRIAQLVEELQQVYSKGNNVVSVVGDNDVLVAPADDPDEDCYGDFGDEDMPEAVSGMFGQTEDQEAQQRYEQTVELWRGVLRVLSSQARWNRQQREELPIELWTLVMHHLPSAALCALRLTCSFMFATAGTIASSRS